jgi:hypothetical protein
LGSAVEALLLGGEGLGRVRLERLLGDVVL